MRHKKGFAAIGAAITLAAAAAITGLALSGGHAPAAPSAQQSVTTTSSAATAACSKLSASALPPATYDLLVTGAAAHASPAAAKAKVAAEVRAACPQFSYLAKKLYG